MGIQRAAAEARASLRVLARKEATKRSQAAYKRKEWREKKSLLSKLSFLPVTTLRRLVAEHGRPPKPH